MGKSVVTSTVMVLNEALKNPKLPHSESDEYWVFFDKLNKPYLVHLQSLTQSSQVVANLKLTSFIFRVYNLPKPKQYNPLSFSNELGMCVLFIEQTGSKILGKFGSFMIGKQENSGRGIGSELFRLANYTFNRYGITHYTGFAKAIHYRTLSELISMYEHLGFKTNGSFIQRDVYPAEISTYKERIHPFLVPKSSQKYFLIAPRKMPKTAVLKQISKVSAATIAQATYYENAHHTSKKVVKTNDIKLEDLVPHYRDEDLKQLRYLMGIDNNKPKNITPSKNQINQKINNEMTTNQPVPESTELVKEKK